MEEAKAKAALEQDRLTVIKREIPSQPVELAVARRVTKSRAQKFLRRIFNEARFQDTTTFEERAAGIATWQLWCKGSYGRMVALVEVTAPPEVLPYAVAREACNRIGCDLQVNAETMQAIPRPKPAPKPVEVTPLQLAAGTPAVSAEAQALAAHHSCDPEAAQAALDAEK